MGTKCLVSFKTIREAWCFYSESFSCYFIFQQTVSCVLIIISSCYWTVNDKFNKFKAELKIKHLFGMLHLAK